MLLLAVLCCLFSSCALSYKYTKPSQYNALWDLYNATNGPSWQWTNSPYGGMPWNFDGTSDPCGNFWQGVLCDMYECNVGTCVVLDLNLTKMGLVGTLPTSLGAFTHMQQLDLSHNDINGSLPSQIGNMSFMENFVVGYNSLTGMIPTTFGPNCSYLRAVFLNNNFFSGSIPTAMLQSTYLQTLYLSGNNLQGSFPTELCNVAVNLSFISLDYNSLTGSMPDSIFASCRQLEYVSAIENDALGGTLPTSLYGLSLLYQLSLTSNSFSGSLSPIGLGQLSNLVVLRLEENHFSGTVPSVVATFAVLQTMMLQGNAFVGDANSLFSTYQTVLQNVDLSDNTFSHAVPAEAFNLPSLRTFAATKNCFSGTLPATLCGNGTTSSTGPAQLQVLVLDGLAAADKCALFGFLHVIPFLRGVISNGLAGTVPQCVFSLTSLETLHISGNGMEGRLVASLPNTSALVNLSLSHNRITGHIPDGLQRWPFNELDLSYNRLHGSIQKMQNLPFVYPTTAPTTPAEYNYTTLSLLENRFSGGIPASFMQALHVDILQGNLFACPDDDADLPHSDPTRGYYSCGSQEYSHAVIVLLGFFAAVLLLAVGKLYYSYYHDRESPLYKYQNQPRPSQQHGWGGWFGHDGRMSLSVEGEDGVTMGTASEEVSRIPRRVCTGLNRCAASVCRLLYRILHDMYHAPTVIREYIAWIHFWSRNHLYLPEQRQHQQEGKVGDHTASTTPSTDTLPGRRQYKVDAPNLYRYIGLMRAFRRLSVLVTAFSVLLLLPLYATLYTVDRQTYSTHSELYMWVSTAAYLTGLLPAILLLILWGACGLTGVYSSIVEIHHRLLQVLRNDASMPLLTSLSLRDASQWVRTTSSAGASWIRSSSIFSSTTNGSRSTSTASSSADQGGGARTFSLVDRLSALNFTGSAGSGPGAGAGSGAGGSHSNQEEMVSTANPVHASAAAGSSTVESECSEQHEGGGEDEDEDRGRSGGGGTVAVYSPAPPTRTESVASEASPVKPKPKSTARKLRILTLSSLFFALNAVIALFVNCAYILLLQNRVLNADLKVVVQISLAAFKLLWNQIVVRVAVDYVKNPTKILPHRKKKKGKSGGGQKASTAIATGAPSPLRAMPTGDVSGTNSDSSASSAPPQLAANEQEALENTTRNMRLHVSALIFNFLVAPVIATMATDSSCFYNLFVPAAKVTSSYSFEYCSIAYLEGNGGVACAETSYPTFSTSYTPPFIYNYGCASAVITSYLPVYMYTYAFVCILTPLVYAGGCFLHRGALPAFVLVQIDAIMRPQNEASVPFRALFKADAVVALQIQHLSVLLTFGLMCPVLALIGCAAICTTTLMWQFIIVRYVNHYHTRRYFKSFRDDDGGAAVVTNAQALGPFGNTKDPANEAAPPPAAFGPESLSDDPTEVAEIAEAALDAECGTSWRGLRESTFVILTVSALFYSFVLFDITADSSTDKVAFAVSGCCVAVPVLLWVHYRYKKYHKHGQRSGPKDSSKLAAAALIREKRRSASVAKSGDKAPSFLTLQQDRPEST